MPVIQNVDTITQGHGVKCCVYGKPGVGKTRLAITAPAPIIISAESGLLSLRGSGLPAIVVRNIAELFEAYQWCFSAEARQFQTVFLDSISDIAEVILTYEKTQTKDGRKAHGETIDKMMDLFRKFRDIQYKHVVMLAKEEYEDDPNSGGKWFRPSMPNKKLSQDLPYFFDEIWQLVAFKNTDGSAYTALRTVTDGSNIAKDRSGRLTVWEQPDLTAMFNKMMA